MADPPPGAVSASPQPDQLAATVSTPQNPNPNPLFSPSPTVSDLSAHISSPQQLDPAAAAAASAGGSMDYPARPPASGAGQIHPSGSASRLSTASQLPQYAAMTRMYGGQMSFSGGGGQVIRQQQLTALSPQKVAGQGLTRTASIAALNSQIPGSSQNGQMVAMSMPQQQQSQQWMKPLQSSMGSPVSPQQQFQQQRLLIMQQLQQKAGLSQQQIAQAQQNPHLTANQLMQQQQLLQQFQQQQSQQSPRISASGSQKSSNLTGSQPGAPMSGGTMTGGSASQGEDAASRSFPERSSSVEGKTVFLPEEKDLESDEALWSLYERWCKALKQERKPDEMARWFNIFKKSARIVHHVNTSDLSWKAELNHLADGKNCAYFFPSEASE